MSRPIDPDTIETIAARLQGNWRKWQAFAWTPPDDGNLWAIYYIRSRDSGLCEQSNAAQIELELKPFTDAECPDLVFERHSHFLVGWVEGYVVRVRTSEGVLTPAFVALASLIARMEDYPLLNEDDHSEREQEALWENVESEGRGIVANPEDGEWVGKVLDYWERTDQGTLENRDDHGGYLTRDQIREACEAEGIALDE